MAKAKTGDKETSVANNIIEIVKKNKKQFDDGSTSGVKEIPENLIVDLISNLSQFVNIVDNDFNMEQHIKFFEHRRDEPIVANGKKGIWIYGETGVKDLEKEMNGDFKALGRGLDALSSILSGISESGKAEVINEVKRLIESEKKAEIIKLIKRVKDNQSLLKDLMSSNIDKFNTAEVISEFKKLRSFLNVHSTITLEELTPPFNNLIEISKRGDFLSQKLNEELEGKKRETNIYEKVTVLHRAVKSGNIEEVDRLREDPNMDVNFMDAEGKTALLIAVELRRADLVSILLRYPTINTGPQDQHFHNILNAAINNALDAGLPHIRNYISNIE